MTHITSVEALEEIYGQPAKPSLIKEVAKLVPPYRAFIEKSPFCALASIGPEGMDCTPRGDRPGFVRIEDDETLIMPDRRGNNRIDTLKNIVRDPRVALCFLIPGSNSCLRVNGEAKISIDPELLVSFAVDEKAPRSAIVIKTKAIYFQCGRAILRSQLWKPEAQIDPKTLPSAGDVLAFLSNHEVGGKTYDEEWQGRAEKTLW